MNIIVQKFGGTSVATQESRKRVIEIITAAKNEYEGVIVVVSAMGRYGAPYATDTLLSLIDHDTGMISDYEADLLMSTGELISSVVLSYQLNIQGIRAKALSGPNAGIITDKRHTKASVTRVENTNIMNLLQQGYIVIVPGFQGRTEDHEITTLGRGGSDTSAAILGEAFQAKAIEIYTDVDGIMTADPKLCDQAKSIEYMTYHEVFQMADSGAKVIHKGAVEVAQRANIPLIIKNTFSNHSGTSIMDARRFEKQLTVEDKLITSIAHKVNRVQLTVTGSLNDDSFFSELAQSGVSIDIINIFPKLRVFTIDKEKQSKAIEVISKYCVPYELIEDCAKVTVVGEKMTGVPGVMARIVHALKLEDIEILQTADSLSTISCLVHRVDVEKAVKALHHVFDLG